MKGFFTGLPLVTILLVCCVLPVCCGCRPPDNPPTADELPIEPEVPVPGGYEEVTPAHLIAAHNAERRRRNITALTVSPLLMSVAQQHADWMAEQHVVSHSGSGGSGFVERVLSSGYSLRIGGENLAVGHADVDNVLEGWIDDADHRRNILEPVYQQCGVGIAESDRHQLYWCVVFASPHGVSADNLQVEVYTNLPDPLESQ